MVLSFTEVGITNANNTSYAKSGQTVKFTFTSSLALTSISDSDVTFKSGGITTTNAATISNSGNTWTAQYTTHLDDTEGDISCKINYEYTLNGLKVYDQISTDDITNESSVYFDKTAPTLTTVSISSDNSTSIYAKPGDTVTLTITPSETINEPTVVFTSGGDAITNYDDISYSNTTGNTWTASYIVVSGDTNGSVGFTITYSDLAGNSGTQVTSVTDGTSVTVDTDPPTLTAADAVTIASDNSVTTQAIIGDTVTLTITPSEPINQPTVVFTSNSSVITNSDSITYSNTTGDIWTASYVVDSDDSSGSVGFTITYSDLAGNSGSQVISVTDGTSVTVDTVRPTLSSVRIASSTNTAYASEGDTITLTFEANADLENSPTVVFYHSGVEVENETISVTNISGATEWTATYGIDSLDANQGGLVTFSIDFKKSLNGLSGDTVTSVTDGTSVTVDIWDPYLQQTSITTSNSTSSTVATEGDTITLTFEIANITPINTHPTVKFKIQGSIYDATVSDPPTTTTSSNANETNTNIYTYTATYTIQNGTNDGDVSYVISSYTDAAGNVGTGITQYGTGVYVDKVEPELISVVLGHENTDNTSLYVIAGQTVLLTIRANESITAPTVSFTSDSAPVENSVTVSAQTSTETTSASGEIYDTVWKASYVVSADDQEGEIGFTISDYTDLAGEDGVSVNQTSSMVSGFGLEVDVTPPSLSNISISSDNSDITKATTDDTVTLEFTASKTISTPTVVFTSGDDAITNSVSYNNTSSNTWTASYSVNSSDTVGDVTFTIDYQDIAGNSGDQVTSVTNGSTVTVDNIAPTLSDISISSDNQYDTTKATSNDIVTLTFTASETINQATVVFTSGGDAITNSDAISYNSNSSNTWTAQYTVSSNDSNHKVSYTITVSDATGNTTTETMDSDADTVIVDLTAPTIDTTTTNLINIAAPENTSNNYYDANNTIIIGVTFDKNVQIKSDSTSPSIVLNSGGTASYKENLDNIIHFSYTVGASENSSPLNIVSLTPFNNGTSIIDSIGNVADLTLSSAKTVLKNENITIDTTAPNLPTNWTITSTRSGSDNYFQYASEGDTVTVSLTFDEKVTISSASFTSNNISVTNAAYGSNWSTSSRSHTVSYEVDSDDTQGVVGFSITYADEAGNTTTTTDENDAYQTYDSTTTFETINIDLTAATLMETSFGEITGKTEVKAGDTIRLEFSSSESVAYNAYGTDVPTVVFYGLNSSNEHIDTVSATQVTDDNTVNNSTTWAYEGDVPADTAIVEMAYKVTEAYDKAGNLSTLEDTNDFIEVDEVPPSINSTTIISNNSLNTSYAKSGDIVTLTINPSETINQPTVYFKVTNTATANNSITTSTVYSEQSNSNTWTATYTINDTYDGDGDLYYTIASYTDLADNSGDSFNQDSDGATSTVINVLTSTPTLSAVSILSYNANTSSKAKDGDTVTVYFNGTRTLNSATVTFLSDSESVSASSSSYSTYDWEASYTVSGSDSDGVITFTISFEDLAGNTSTTSSTTDSTSVTIDNTAPTINAITTDAFSWGTYLNIDESSSDATVDVTTSGVEDNQTLTLTLNDETYTGTVTSNACTVTISQAGLNALTDGSIYYLSADVSDLVGNAATTVNSSLFTVDTTSPTIINIKGISEANSYKADDIITIALRFSETVYVVGSPSLNLSDANATATYDSGSGSTILLFKYTVSSGDSTISSNEIGYLNVTSITYDSSNYIEDVANNEADYTVIDEGNEHSLSYNTEIVIDTTAPSDFQVGTVEAQGGIYDAGYYNSSNTSVNIHVPIDNDVSLVGGTVRLIYSTNNTSTYNTTAFSSYDYTIITAGLDTIYTFSVNEVDFESNIDESAEIHFSAIITDKAGNQTTGSASSDTIIRDDIPPHPVTVGTITADGGRVAQNYYNSTNDGLTISVPINNNPLLVRPDNATTLIAGTVQVLVSVDNGVSYNEIGDLVEIETADLLTNKEIVLTDQEFIGAVAEGETALFNVTITDQADNITSSSPAPPDVTVSPAPDYTTYDPYANSPSNGFIRQETLPPIPKVSFTTGSTKNNYNNKISVRLDSTIVKWDYTTNFGANYTTIYNNNGTFISLAAGVYLPGSIIIRNYDIADNRSLVSNTNKIIISSSRQGFPLANQSSSSAMNKMKGFAFSRGASR